MNNDNSSNPQCQLGLDTLLAMIRAGYGSLAVGLLALYEHGFMPNEVFSRTQFLDCGLGEDISKTIMNQCEGREFDRHKTKKSSKKPKRIAKHQQRDLDWIIGALMQAQKPSKVLGFIKSNLTTINDDLFVVEESRVPSWMPPEADAVKDLFANFQYENKCTPLDLSQFKAKRGRGRPGRLCVLPPKDKLAELFGICKADSDQKHYDISGHKKVKSLFDALYFEWMKHHEHNEDNRHAMSELSSVLSESPKTVRNRHERLDIKSHRNYFLLRVNSLELDGLLINCRMGCWLQLELSNDASPVLMRSKERRKQMKKRIAANHYPVNKSGLDQARKEWEGLGSPGKFLDHLRLGGLDFSSYELPE